MVCTHGIPSWAGAPDPGETSRTAGGKLKSGVKLCNLTHAECLFLLRSEREHQKIKDKEAAVLRIRVQRADALARGQAKELVTLRNRKEEFEQVPAVSQSVGRSVCRSHQQATQITLIRSSH